MVQIGEKEYDNHDEIRGNVIAISVKQIKNIEEKNQNDEEYNDDH